MKRILVIGSPGGGKTTLAIHLSKVLGLPVYHLDKLFWQPGWKPADDATFYDAQREAMSGAEWIIDGNYSRSLNIRLPHADTVVHLDFPRRICIWRIFRRIVTHWGRTRPDMGDGCRERFDLGFVKWVWSFPHRHRPLILAAIERHRSRFNLITLTGPDEVSAFLAELGAPPESDKNLT